MRTGQRVRIKESVRFWGGRGGIVVNVEPGAVWVRLDQPDGRPIHTTLRFTLDEVTVEMERPASPTSP